MPNDIARAIDAALQDPISDADALALAEASQASLPSLMAAASARRDRAFGARDLTYSPKVFLPLTNLCRNHCDYCSFRRSGGDEGEWTMTPAQVLSWLDRAAALGCTEALFCLGDRPDIFPSYRAKLEGWGHRDTVEYLHWAGLEALSRGLLPHTNAGVLDPDAMARLKEVNVSLGLMLENVSPRLCQRGMPHHRAPDKRPEVRIEMTREAGLLKIPFTSGLLVGIGETRIERVETLLCIRRLHRTHGHIQEVIVQNFRASQATPMSGAPEPIDIEVAHAVAMARIIMPDDVSVQAPPNLNPGATAILIRAGINDFGGVSPTTPDYINPGHPWPNIEKLADICREQGRLLRPRLPIYPPFQSKPGFLDGRLQALVEAAQKRLPASAHAIQPTTNQTGARH